MFNKNDILIDTNIVNATSRKQHLGIDLARSRSWSRLKHGNERLGLGPQRLVYITSRMRLIQGELQSRPFCSVSPSFLPAAVNKYRRSRYMLSRVK